MSACRDPYPDANLFLPTRCAPQVQLRQTPKVSLHSSQQPFMHTAVSKQYIMPATHTPLCENPSCREVAFLNGADGIPQLLTTFTEGCYSSHALAAMMLICAFEGRRNGEARGRWGVRIKLIQSSVVPEAHSMHTELEFRQVGHPVTQVDAHWVRSAANRLCCRIRAPPAPRVSTVRGMNPKLDQKVSKPLSLKARKKITRRLALAKVGHGRSNSRISNRKGCRRSLSVITCAVPTRDWKARLAADSSPDLAKLWNVSRHPASKAS